MNILRIYNQDYINSLTFIRSGEEKLGEKIQVVSSLDGLKKSTARYVLFGIPEDIGVMANYGLPGTRNAWKCALKALLNIQANTHTKAGDILVLGEIDCSHELNTLKQMTPSEMYFSQLGNLIKIIDEKVAFVVETIVKADKIPIIIGGGHNNSYGNLKGTSKAFGQPVNAVNFDAHTDFRPLEHRHSGNGFSYAYQDGFLNKYFIFGLHKNYTSNNVFEQLEKNKSRIAYSLYESIKVEQTISFEEALKQAETFVSSTHFGLEIDMDAIQNIPSSASSPIGFTTDEARRFVRYFSKNKNLSYIHLCEAAPKPDTAEEKTIGKLLSYLINDVVN